MQDAGEVIQLLVKMQTEQGEELEDDLQVSSHATVTDDHITSCHYRYPT